MAAFSKHLHWFLLVEITLCWLGINSNQEWQLEPKTTFHKIDQNYTKTRGEILIMHGSADKAITMDQFADLANELESAGVVHEMITYGVAQHAFTVFGGNRR